MDAQLRSVAAALGGDPRHLGDLARSDADGAVARRHRVSGALYLRAGALRIEGPALPAWRRDMILMSARYMLLGQALESCAEVLSAVGVAWIPLKGFDLAKRVYREVEERVTSDLDLLIAAADVDRARTALCEAGWNDVHSGPRAQRYLAEEGYALQLTGQGVLLEVHFRLWGSVAEGLAADVVAASSPDPELPTGGRRSLAAHAYVIAAVHAWLSSPPRGAGIWRDLERLSASSLPTLVGEVVDVARRWDLQLPVALASEIAAELWHDEVCDRIAAELVSDLRGPERLMRGSARRRGLAQASLALLTASRLASGRQTRLRGKIAWRRLWDHAGVVEVATPGEWPWIARRLAHQLTALGFRVPARRAEAADQRIDP